MSQNEPSLKDLKQSLDNIAKALDFANQKGTFDLKTSHQLYNDYMAIETAFKKYTSKPEKRNDNLGQDAL